MYQLKSDDSADLNNQLREHIVAFNAAAAPRARRRAAAAPSPRRGRRPRRPSPRRGRAAARPGGAAPRAARPRPRR